METSQILFAFEKKFSDGSLFTSTMRTIRETGGDEMGITWLKSFVARTTKNSGNSREMIQDMFGVDPVDLFGDDWCAVINNYGDDDSDLKE